MYALKNSELHASMTSRLSLFTGGAQYVQPAQQLEGMEALVCWTGLPKPEDESQEMEEGGDTAWGLSVVQL